VRRGKVSLLRLARKKATKFNRLLLDKWLHSILPWTNESDFVNTLQTGKSGLDADFLIDDYVPNVEGWLAIHFLEIR